MSNPETNLIALWFEYHPIWSDTIATIIKAKKNDDETIQNLAVYLQEIVERELIEVEDDTLNGVIVAHFTSQIDYIGISQKMVRDYRNDLGTWVDPLYPYSPNL